MNEDTMMLAEQICKDAGAIVVCGICGATNLDACDEDANGMAYAMATNAWKKQERGFRFMAREEVLSCIKSVLDDAAFECHTCRRTFDDD